MSKRRTVSVRADFVAAEHRALLAFDSPHGSAPRRNYTCECGYQTTRALHVFDHARDCNEPPTTKAPLAPRSAK